MCTGSESWVELDLYVSAAIGKLLILDNLSNDLDRFCGSAASMSTKEEPTGLWVLGSSASKDISGHALNASIASICSRFRIECFLGGPVLG